ncbi:MAG TPA: PTS sugar transporter subunit IIA [bacterium]|jgi:PTS system nitrogen regulatory IIA component|nr:PTS sugar transporter subunit IIA [bacterium]
MRISDFLVPEAVLLDLKSTTKQEVLSELLQPLAKAGRIADAKKMVDVLLEREELGSTGIGGRIAIPHGKAAQVKELAASLGVSKAGISFDALDGEPVNLFIALVAPEGSAGLHLKALARISSLLKDKAFKKALLSAATREDVLRLIETEEKEKG